MLPLQELQMSCCRRLLAQVPALETIHVDIWTVVVPSASYTPKIIWSNITSPDPRLWNATNTCGVPMNLTFSSATVYSVRNNW